MAQWSRRQANHNEAVSSHLSGQQNLHAQDWAITALFYAALKLVDGYIWRTQHRRPSSHKDRQRNYIEHDPVLQTVEVEYGQLEDLSRRTRYRQEFRRFSNSDVQDAKGYYGVIETTLRRYL